MKASDDQKKNKISKNVKSNPKWNESEKQTFLLNINKNKIQAINNPLCDLHQSNNVNTDDINKICTDIGSIFVSAAEATSGKSNVHHIHILQIIAQIQNHCWVINAKTLVESTESK